MIVRLRQSGREGGPPRAKEKRKRGSLTRRGRGSGSIGLMLDLGGAAEREFDLGGCFEGEWGG